MMHFIDLTLLVEGGHTAVLGSITMQKTTMNLCRPPWCFAGICYKNVQYSKYVLNSLLWHFLNAKNPYIYIYFSFANNMLDFSTTHLVGSKNNILQKEILSNERSRVPNVLGAINLQSANYYLRNG